MSITEKKLAIIGLGSVGLPQLVNGFYFQFLCRKSR